MFLEAAVNRLVESIVLQIICQSSASLLTFNLLRSCVPLFFSDVVCVNDLRSVRIRDCIVLVVNAKYIYAVSQFMTSTLWFCNPVSDVKM